jgi:hypothetical protein
MLSVYRLDWLEEIGVLPRGVLVDVADRIYFSHEPFTLEDFTRIAVNFSMDGMVNNNAIPQFGVVTTTTPATYALDVDMSGCEVTFGGVAAIMGMWGVNDTVMEENGKTVPYYATDAYRSALTFLSSLSAAEAILQYYSGNDPSPQSFFVQRRNVGWACIHIESLFAIVGRVLRAEPSAKILVTPPETGADGSRGIGMAGLSRPFDLEMGWVIKGNVGNDKLARILTMFDAMSFDPETYVAVNHGFAGDHFEWAGEPYLSAIVPRSGMDNELNRIWNGFGVFSTGIVDGRAARREYTYGPNYIYDYAASQAARGMVIRPHREKPPGKLDGELDALNERYGTLIHNTVRNYFRGVLSGSITDVEATWDGYLDELVTNGLDQYIALYGLYE